MSITNRISTAFFTALPGSLFVVLVISSNMYREYFWSSILTGVSVLFGSALLLGFVQSPQLRPKWVWIITAGFAAMVLALLVITVLNATPLCVGQDNGDGNNSIRHLHGIRGAVRHLLRHPVHDVVNDERSDGTLGDEDIRRSMTRM